MPVSNSFPFSQPSSTQTSSPKAAAGRDLGETLNHPFSAWTVLSVLPERKIKDRNPPQFAISNLDPGRHPERPCEVRYTVKGDTRPAGTALPSTTLDDPQLQHGSPFPPANRQKQHGSRLSLLRMIGWEKQFTNTQQPGKC